MEGFARSCLPCLNPSDWANGIVRNPRPAAGEAMTFMEGRVAMRLSSVLILPCLVEAIMFAGPLEASTLTGLVGNGVIHLRWTQNGEAGLDGYRVYYGMASGVYDGTAAVQGSSPVTVPVAALFDAATPEFSLVGLEGGVEHYFQVRAVVSGGETDPSNEISLVPGGWPAHIAAANPFQNPGFEANYANWNCQWNTGNILSSIDPDHRLFGSKSLKIVNTNPTVGTYRISSSQDPPTTANTDYLVTFWARGGPATNGSCFFMIMNMDAGWDKRFGVPAGTYPWTRVSYIYNTGPSNQCLVAFASELSGTVWVDEIEMVRLADADVGPPYPENFARLASNPVLTVGAPGSLDDAHVYSPSVLKEGEGAYRMYYTMHDGTNTRVGLANSDNGTEWTKHAGNPVLDLGANGTFDDAHVQPSSALKVGSVYHLYYNAHDGATYRIGHATSSDGIVWTRDPANPVLGEGNEGPFVSTYVMTPSVLYEDGMFRMWYAAYDGNGSKRYHIGYATSPEGSVFTRQGIAISPGGLGEIDMVHCAYPRVAKVSDDGYVMWYAGYGPNAYSSCRAVSSDGVSWAPVGSDLAPSIKGGFDARQVCPGTIVPEAASNRMWYMGYGIDNVWRIGVADEPYTPTPTSTDTPTPTVTPTPTDTPLATATATPAAPTPFPADINEDGIVDYRDALILQQQWHWEQD